MSLGNFDSDDLSLTTDQQLFNNLSTYQLTLWVG